mmetsp:Transcript_18871/g.62259  ORF Transcript_18871/g.62259 Transcript_18871/m.62259 type:complete len:202 (-) Transcript_18871:807-1412(-)
MAESTEPRPNPRSHHILPPGLSKRALTPPLLLGGQPLLPRGRRRSRRRAACPRPRPARPLGRRPRWAEAARVTWARRPPGARSRGRGWHICPSWPRSPQWPPANEASATRRPTRRRRGPRAPPAPSLKPRWAGAPASPALAAVAARRPPPPRDSEGWCSDRWRECPCSCGATRRARKAASWLVVAARPPPRGPPAPRRPPG